MYPRLFPRPPIRTITAACLWAAVAAWPFQAPADTRALIMGIGDYRGAANDLPGAGQDLRLAQDIAHALGIADADMTILSDQQLTRAGMHQAFDELTAKTREDDRVFVYYTGHGGRMMSDLPAPPHCAEALIAQDGQGLFDRELAAHLDKLRHKAEKLVVFLDSCFSGGATTRALGAPPPPGILPKFAKMGGQDGHCAAVNLGETRALGAATRGLGETNYVYIAASKPNEVSYQLANGSAATLAWRECLGAKAQDQDHSGGISADEIRDCAQRGIDQRLPVALRHHVTLTGNTRMALDFAAPPEPASAPADPARQPARAAPAQTLQDIYANRDDRREVRLNTERRSLRIGHDKLELTIDSARSGQVYLVMAGSDGQAFTVLFPNGQDQDNRIEAGQTLRLPRSGWELAVQGPAGQDTLLAVVADKHRNIGAVPATEAGPFPVIDGNLGAAGGLQNALRRGGYGAALLTVKEVR